MLHYTKDALVEEYSVATQVGPERAVSFHREVATLTDCITALPPFLGQT